MDWKMLCATYSDDDSYRVVLEKPLGLILEEVVPDRANGVEVGGTQEGSNSEACGLVQPGDRLLAVGEDDAEVILRFEVLRELH